jgi:hypothetical protein
MCHERDRRRRARLRLHFSGLFLNFVSLGVRRRAWPQPARCLGTVFEQSGMYANNLVRISEVIRDEYLAIKLKSHFLPKGRNELLQYFPERR